MGLVAHPTRNKHQQQHMIKDQRKLIIRKASAGAGKTFTLVKEYIKMAFTGAQEGDLDSQFSHILAITFTKKATSEMKERITKELDEMARMNGASDMGKIISKETGIPCETLGRYAERVRHAILHNYSELSVTTIDSFMQGVVKSFAHDLNLPMNFEVMTDKSDLVQMSVDDLMGLAGQDDEQELTKMLTEFAESEMEDGHSYMVENQIANLAEKLFTEGTSMEIQKFKHMTPTDFSNLKAKLKKENLKFEQDVQAKAKEAIDLLTAKGIGISELFQGSKGIGGFFNKYASGNAKNLNDPQTTNKNIEAFISKDNVYATKCTHKAEIDAIHPTLVNIYNELVKLLTIEAPKYNTRRQILGKVYALAVLNRLEKIIAQESYDNDLVHISEFNKRIAEVVREEYMPFVYERVGCRYRYILIDEFQDTSKEQWQNLMPLVSEALSQGHTCLIVGDGKQAIYRFRKGDVEQFTQLPAVDCPHDYATVFTQNGVADLATMKMNFRTRQNVVKFNNEFYKWAVNAHYTATDHPEIHKIYWGDNPGEADLEQTALEKSTDGLVQVEFLGDGQGKEDLWKSMLEDIRHMVSLGYKYSDITILARYNNTLTDISTYFASDPDGLGVVPMVSNESFLMKNSKILTLMVSALKYLLDNNDRQAATQVLTMLKQLGITIHDFTSDLTNTQNHYLVDLHTILQHDNIDFNAEQLRSMTLYDCCEELIRTFKIQQIETPYLTSMLNKVAAYSKTHRQDLAEFIEWFEKNIDNKMASHSSGAQDAVTLMTIHKSKGLESKVIMYALPTTQNKPNEFWADLKDDDMGIDTCLVSTAKSVTTFKPQTDKENRMKELDEFNVLYVATTRPVSRLMVYCSKPAANPSSITPIVLFDQFLKSNTLAWNTVNRSGRTLYQYGIDKFYEDKDKPTNDTLEIGTLAFKDWAETVKIAKQAQKIFDTSSEERIKEGVTLHEILALMRNTSDADTALDTYASANGLDEEKKEAIRQQLNKLLTQTAFTRFFNPDFECINECNIMMDYIDNDGVKQRGVKRPDRIVMANGETWVVDFKTGKPSESYHTQLKNYCDALKDMGFPNVQGFLLYLHEGNCKVEQVI